jgi:hypothetical protein
MLANRHKQHRGVVAAGRIFPTIGEGALVFLTFSQTLVAWVFFRSPTLVDAIAYLSRMVTFSFSGVSGYGLFIHPLLLAIPFLCVEWIQRGKPHGLAIGKIESRVLRWAIYLIVLQVIIFAGEFSGQEFIYFQF